MAEPAESGFSAAELAAANINPVTYLATDYLNHFNNVVMLLEIISDMPECADEVLSWRPAGYADYFAHSHFRERDLAIAAYHASHPSVRGAFEATVGELDRTMGEAQSYLTDADPSQPAVAEQIMLLLSTRFKPLISQASGIINGSGRRDASADLMPKPNAQDTVDELFP